MRVSSIASLDFRCCCIILLRYQPRKWVHFNCKKIAPLKKKLQNFVSFNFGHFAFLPSGPCIDHGNEGKGLVTYLEGRGKAKEALRECFAALVDEVAGHMEVDEVTDL